MRTVICFITAVILACLAVPVMAAENPVAMLIDAKGGVFYSPDGEIWKSVNRNKFLFEGWRVKTGKDGVCKVLKQQSDMIEVLATGTEVEIGSESTRVLHGNISDTRPARSLNGFLQRKFAGVQNHTGVQRSAKTGRDPHLETIKNITLSADYPDLVWENIGPEYSYQLYVGDNVFDVPGTEEKTVRFRLPKMEAGENDYCVNVIYKGEVLYAPEERNSIQWLSEEKKSGFYQELAAILEIAPDNHFLLGRFMDEKGFTVVAMDSYRKFMEDNPDDAHEAGYFLNRVFEKLKLEKLKKEKGLAKYPEQQE